MTHFPTSIVDHVVSGFRIKPYIKHSRQCLTTVPNTSKFVKNTPLRVVFSTLFLGAWKSGQTRSFAFDILRQLTSLS